MAFGDPQTHRVPAVSGFPLVQAGDGERVEIVSVDGGAGAQRKLAHLGLAPGKTIEIVTRQPGGPLLVAVGETRVAVGFGLALKVKVAAAASSEQAP
jgi:ferrous iron transport protein A